MKHFSFLFCLLLIIGTNSFITAKAQVDKNDSLALVDLFNNTNGPGWRNHGNWLTRKPVDNWFGITVKGARVIKIDLALNNLTGTIPSSIGNLVNLSFLQLIDNQLSGTVPSTIGSLVNLESLILHGNQLIGTIPSSIGNLVQLTDLDLAYNQLSGSIPSSITKLVNLGYLDLKYNQLSGAIPTSIGNLVKLTNLFLENNQLSGTIPSSMGNLVNLTFLNIENNQLSGTIPSSMGNLVNVINLALGGNQLSGSIPSSFKNLVKLLQLSLWFNQLSGNIPSFIGNFTNLNYLSLSGNHFTGSIPASLGNLAQLQSLLLNINELTGSIPRSFRNFTNMGMELDNNELSQPNNVDFPRFDRPFVYGNVSYNHNTFNGLEFIATKYPNVTYAPQAIIPLHQHGNTLSVYAGGTLSNNTYNWFKVGEKDGTIIKGDSTFTPTQSGKYYVKVTNAIATKLTLFSDTINFTGNTLLTDTRLITGNNIDKVKQVLQVSPNPASSTVRVQLSGTGVIVLTSSTGKVLLSKTITNNAAIDVSSLANGIYFIKNTTTGAVQRFVVAH